MSRENSAGLGNRNHYGARIVDQTLGGVFGGVSGRKTGKWEFDLATTVTQSAAGISDATVILTGNAGTGMEPTFKAYSKILSCRLEVIEAVATTSGSAATTGSFSVGLIQDDGSTAIDLDGLIDATDGAVTITSNDVAEPRGEYKLGGSAALVPDYGTAATPGETVSIGANAGELYIALISDDSAGQATLTGRIRVVVEWIEE